MADEKRIAQYMGRCVHFTGLWGPGMVKHETCAAGVRYDAVRVDHDPIEYGEPNEGGRRYSSSRSHPCLAKYNHAGATCEKLCWPTREAAEAHVAKSDAEIQNYIRARAAVVATKQESGGIACPVCTTGILDFAVAPSNGHIHAKCRTEGCVAWME